MEYERLFLEQLSTIERVARSVANRHRLPASDRDDFVSLVRLRLIEGDYRVLREFEGRSAFSTYLTIVITRLFLDYRNQRWGRWRASARATRLGPIAELLERLVHRDGHTLDEAIGILRHNHRISESESALRALWAELPSRVVPTVVGDEAASRLAQTATTPEADLAATRDEPVIVRIVGEVLAGLSADDRLLVALHFGHGVPLVQAARRMGLSKATAHRRVARTLGQCRAALGSAGIDQDRLRAVVARGATALSTVLDAVVETTSPRGRLTS